MASIDPSAADKDDPNALKPLASAALWRHHAAKSVRHWKKWLEENTLINPAMSNSLDAALDQLSKVHFTIAVVAEVSRGKSELINAMLFANYGQRVVPSGVGRTTMCPTEFFCNKSAQPYIELLPIETRKGEATFSQLFASSNAWVRFHIDQNNEDVMVLALQKVCETQQVTAEFAASLGLGDDALDDLDSLDPSHASTPQGHAGEEQSFSTDADLQAQQHLIEIPKWRYARVNYHHPLLASGLAILDTPGLNATGHEPELTYAVLPMVDAAMYLLAADVGVSRSEYASWQTHLSQFDENNKIAVINKIDTLNDSLRSPLASQADIIKQIERSAAALKLPKEQVYAVSAQQALLARISNDTAQLQRSRLPLLENTLSHQLLDRRHDQLRSHTRKALAYSYQIAAQYLQGIAQEGHAEISTLESLRSLGNTQQGALLYETETAERRQQHYAIGNGIRSALASHESNLMQTLSGVETQKAFDQITTSQPSMSASSLKTQTEQAIAALIARFELAVYDAIEPLGDARKALAKLNRLMGNNQTSLIETLAEKRFNISQYIEELRRMNSTVGNQFSTLPLITSRQREKALQTVAAIGQRCIQVTMLSRQHYVQWHVELKQVIESTLSVHESMVNKRAGTLLRMQQAQQSLQAQTVELQGVLAATQLRIDALDRQYSKALDGVDADRE